MQRLRFIRTINNVTEERKKLKAQLDFIVPIKWNNYNRGGGKGEKKKNFQKILQNKLKNNKCFSWKKKKESQNTHNTDLTFDATQEEKNIRKLSG